jgi:type 1 glutamine amidotransferase
MKFMKNSFLFSAILVLATTTAHAKLITDYDCKITSSNSKTLKGEIIYTEHIDSSIVWDTFNFIVDGKSLKGEIGDNKFSGANKLTYHTFTGETFVIDPGARANAYEIAASYSKKSFFEKELVYDFSCIRK